MGTRRKAMMGRGTGMLGGRLFLPWQGVVPLRRHRRSFLCQRGRRKKGFFGGAGAGGQSGRNKASA